MLGSGSESHSQGQKGRAGCTEFRAVHAVTCVSDEKTAEAAEEASHHRISSGVGREGFPPTSCPSLGHCIVPLMLSLDEPAWEVRGRGLSPSTMDE